LTDLEGLVDAYCSAWFDRDPERRRRLLFQTVEQDVTYVDPMVHIVGIELLAMHINRTVEARPGFWLERTSLVDSHHDFIRFSWVQRRGDDFRGTDCVDICRVTSNGKLSLIVGFFGPLASAPAADSESFIGDRS
jgi:hypothetical protein